MSAAPRLAENTAFGGRVGRTTAHPTRSILAVAAGLLATATLLAGCSPAPTAHWSIDVRYVDLKPGTCLAGSYSSDNALETDTFTVNANYFRAVDCSRPHRAEVVGVVEIPASSQWDDFGTTNGPSIDEAADWLDSACLAYSALVENYLESSRIARSFVVSSSYGILGDPVLGSCIAHTESFEMFTGRGIDVDAMVPDDQQSFDAELLGTAGDWLADPLDGPVSTQWTTLDPFTCVSAYVGPNEEYYDTVACSLPHVAEFVGWVRMPDDWRAYRSDEEASTLVTARCEQIRATIAGAANSPVPEIVVDASAVGVGAVIYGRNLAQCWAHLPDLTDLPVGLRDLAQPPVQP